MQYSHAAQDKFRQAKIIQDQDTQGTQGTQNMQDTQQAGLQPQELASRSECQAKFYVSFFCSTFVQHVLHFCLFALAGAGIHGDAK
jgi:hypothetical protein